MANVVVPTTKRAVMQQTGTNNTKLVTDKCGKFQIKMRIYV